ncbi:MAG: hypothetical protein O3B13_17835, partial [Planctomycetota bacterium]|nr:hypothetical protein [Planctomycetota bacterium]
GDITFTHDAAVNSAGGERNDLELRSGAGTVNVNANMGQTRELQTLVVSDTTGVVTFGGTDTITAAQDGGPVTLIRTFGEINLGKGSEDDDVITSGIVLNGAGTGITFQTSDDDIRFNGQVQLQSDVTLDTSDGAGDVTFTNDASIDSQNGENNGLTIDAGTASVFFNEDIGAVQALGALNIERANGGVLFGTAELETVMGDAGPVDIVRTNGDINIGSINAINGGISLNAGTGSGNVFELTTDGDNVRFNGVVTLDSIDVQISTGTSVGGDVTFEDDLIPEGNETVDLTLTTGTGDIVFNDVAGTAVRRLDDITITLADDVTARNAVTTTTFTQTNGTGTTVFESTLNTNDVTLPGIDINTTAITFEGAVDATGNGRVMLTNQGGTLTIDTGADFSIEGAFLQDGTGDVVVNANVTTSNDEIRFSPSSDPTADVQAAASITLADGTVLATSGNSEIRLRAEGDIRLSRLVTSSVDGLVSVQSDAGAIIDNGDAGGADIVARNLALRAATGIGDDGLADPALNSAAADLPSAIDPKVEASAIDTQVSVLAASNVTSGDIQVSNALLGLFPIERLLTIGTADGLSGITNGDDNLTDGLSGGVVWITNASPIDVSSEATPNDAEGVRNSSGGSVILTAADSVGMGDNLQVFAPIEAMRGTGSVLLNAGDDLTLASKVLTAIGGGVTLQDRVGNIDLNAGNDLTIRNGSEIFDIQTGSLLQSGTLGAEVTVISQAQRDTDFQTSRQIRYTRGNDLVLEGGALLATNIVHQVDPSNGVVIDNRILSNSGVIADFTPQLVEETFATMQVGSDGYATIAGSFGRVLDPSQTGGLESEVNFRLLVAWGDDSFSFHHLTGTTGDAIPATPVPGKSINAPADDPIGVNTSRTFFFEHFYTNSNLPDPANPGSPIPIRVFIQGDPNIVEVSTSDVIVAYDNSNDLLGGETPNSNSFLASDEQFLISELLSQPLDDANLGEFGTGLGARVDTYRAAPVPDIQIAGIQNPNFNTIAPSPFVSSTSTTGGLPAIIDFQFEEAAKVAFELNRSDQPNSSDGSISAEVPGGGIESAAAAFVFDLSADVTTLEFPKVIELVDAFVASVGEKQSDSGSAGQGIQAEDASATERIVWLKVLRPTGQIVDTIPATVDDTLVYSLLPNGKFRVLKVVEEVPLNEEVLDNLPKLIFEKLPDGQFQIWLQEAGERDKRFVMDVTIRDGRPADETSGTRDRPPTSLKKVPADTPKSDEAPGQQPNDGADADDVSDDSDSKVSTLIPAGSPDANDSAWARWGNQFRASGGRISNGANLESLLATGSVVQDVQADSATTDGKASSEREASLKSPAAVHPVAASAILAAGMVISKSRQHRWDERVDDMMARWEERQQNRKQ